MVLVSFACSSPGSGCGPYSIGGFPEPLNGASASGELGRGSFFYACSSCTVFPTCLTSASSITYVPNSDAFEPASVESWSPPGANQSDGPGALIAFHDGRVVDFKHVESARLTGFTLRLDGDEVGETLEIFAYETVQLSIELHANCAGSVGGAEPNVWVSDRSRGSADVEDGDTVSISGISPGSFDVHVQIETFERTLTVVVASAIVEPPTGSGSESGSSSSDGGSSETDTDTDTADTDTSSSSEEGTSSSSTSGGTEP